jgi:serine phosphatase RsbU (regulator of sigma subunit)/PAS domain-containing protein
VPPHDPPVLTTPHPSTATLQAGAAEEAAERSGVGVVDWDLDSGELRGNAVLPALFGVPQDGWTLADLLAHVHPADLAGLRAAVAGAVATGSPFEAEYRVVRAAGAVRWLQARGQVLTGRRGTTVGGRRFRGTIHDTTAVHDRAERTDRIVEAMPTGFLALDTQWRFILLNPAGEALLQVDRETVYGRTLWEVFPDIVGTEVERSYRTAVDTGAPQAVQQHVEGPVSRTFEVLAWPNADGLAVYVSDITARAGAEAEAEQSRARLTLIAGVNADLVTTADVAATVAGIAPRLVPLLADGAMVTLVDPDGLRRDVSVAHREPQVHQALVDYVAVRPNTVPPTSPLGEVLRTGRHVRATAERIAAAVDDGRPRAALQTLGTSWSQHLPIRSRTGTQGALTLFFDADRAADPVDEVTLAEIADRVGIALDNATLVGAQTQLVEALQRSLLTEPPQLDHATVTARYLPAAAAAQIGGDWYDAFTRTDGATVLVIGDVAGHDTAAAAAMGQLRGITRGIATAGTPGPEQVLRGLDTSMDVLGVGVLATAAVLTIDLPAPDGRAAMAWCSAGHPPGLLLRADGTVTALSGLRGDLLLGVDPAAVRAHHRTTLGPGDAVLLYTDGLIERRHTDLDDGLAQLVDTVTGLARTAATLPELCDGVVAQFVDGPPDDDVALIAFRLHPR